MTQAPASDPWNPSAPRDTLPGERHRRRKIRSIDLLGGTQEIVIAHEMDEYLLRVTKNGRLILTK